MAIHTFVCDKCGEIVHDTNTKGIHKCPKCGEDMRWDLSGIGIAAGNYNHISDSLAMHPSQIAEHKRLFPHIDVLPDGRPHFTSIRQQSNYLKEIGMYKEPQKLKNKGNANKRARKKLSKAVSV